MRIAIIQRRMDRLGGAERLVHNLAQGLARNGHAVDMFVYRYASKYWGDPNSQDYNVKFLKLQYIPKFLRIPMAGLYFRFKLRTYDVVNPHNTYTNHWMMLAKLFNPKFPQVIWYCNEPRREVYHDVLDGESHVHWQTSGRGNGLLGRLRIKNSRWRQRFLDKLAFKAMDRIFVNSTFSQAQVKKTFNMDAEVCHAGIELRPAAVETGTTADYFLLVSRIVFHKNIETVLKAFAPLVESGKYATKLVIAGSGPDLEHLKERARNLGMSDHVEFKGYVKDSELDKLYAAAKFFIYIPFAEPFGLVLIEAMQYGIPVIGADDGGGRDIVEHGKEGFLVDVRNVDAVRVAI
ncbi:MAG: glycosyltransferase family 4 protein, partial [Elusimicrobiota bacterium]